ncbi:MAG: zinc ABC transporter substrate-binding protein [Clostridia bacterium]|nr:zinc ABC transporter substrate-binding protein [Clostridia bacterium]
MKKGIALLILIVMLCIPLCVFAGCGVTDDGGLKIVVTIFPEYDWVMNVLGERADEVKPTLLLDNNIDLHSYAPTPDDKIKISQADLFVYVGGESDKWVVSALEEKRNASRKIIDLMETLGDAAKEEELVEGMQEEEEGEEEEGAYDEHVWLSLRNAEIFVDKIAEVLSEIDPEYKALYTANAARYIASLQALDLRYQEMRAAASDDFILVADRFPFRYLVDDYDIKYAAAFKGCAADSEITFETQRKLIDIANEKDVRAILVLESTEPEHRTARTIRDGTTRKDQDILVLDSLQSASEKEYKAGRTYLSVMEENLEVLRKALG